MAQKAAQKLPPGVPWGCRAACRKGLKTGLRWRAQGPNCVRILKDKLLDSFLDGFLGRLVWAARFVYMAGGRRAEGGGRQPKSGRAGEWDKESEVSSLQICRHDNDRLVTHMFVCCLKDRLVS